MMLMSATRGRCFIKAWNDNIVQNLIFCAVSFKNHFEIWHAVQHQCCWTACLISKWYKNTITQSWDNDNSQNSVMETLWFSETNHGWTTACLTKDKQIWRYIKSDNAQSVHSFMLLLINNTINKDNKLINSMLLFYQSCMSEYLCLKYWSGSNIYEIFQKLVKRDCPMCVIT